MSKIEISPIGNVRNLSDADKDSQWGNIESEIILNSDFDESAFEGIEKFSHLEIIFLFDRVNEDNINKGSRHPRAWRSGTRSSTSTLPGSARPRPAGAT